MGGKCSLFDCAEKIGLGDLDDLLSYNTVKLVKVRDYRLGGLFYLMQLAVFIYIVIIAVVIDQGYMKLEDVQSGSAQLNFASPVVVAAPSYCCAAQPCPNGTLPCLYWDHYQATYPYGDASAAVATRVRFTSGVASPAGCTISNWGPNCNYSSTATDNFFIANVENFTLRIRHAVSGFEVDRSGSNSGEKAMKGVLLDGDGNQLRSWSGNRTGDILSIQELFNAADLSFSDVFSGQTLRFNGINIILYVNYKTSGVSGLSYEYKPRSFLDSEFKIEETWFSADGAQRTVINRHGVRVIVVQTGKIGNFNFITMLQTLVTGLALLAVATVVVDQIMIRVMAMRKVYKTHKIQITEDFSSWRALHKKDLHDRMNELSDKDKAGSGTTIVESSADSPNTMEDQRTVQQLFMAGADGDEAEFYKSDTSQA